MSKKTKPTTKPRKQHSAEFKAQALQLAEQAGVTEAARQPGLHTSQIYPWRTAAQRKASTSQRESQLATENARLKRELYERDQEVQILKKAAAYFAKNPK